MLLEELQCVVELVDLGVGSTEPFRRTDALVEDEGVADTLDVEEDDIAITALVGGPGHTRAEVLDRRVSITAVHLGPAFHRRLYGPTVLVAGDSDERHRSFWITAGSVETTHPAEERSDALGPHTSESADGP